MFVLSLCRQLCPTKLPVQPDHRLGEGADGEVLSIIGEPDKVIKLCVLYERPSRPLVKHYSQIRTVLDYMVKFPIDTYVRVYEHGCLGTYSRKSEYLSSGQQSYILYYYIMEKLEKISEDERRIFHSILSHEDRGIEKNFSSEKIREMLQGMSLGLDFDTEKIMLFYEKIKYAPVSHLDIHVRNIMKDSMNIFKLIDLDRVELEKDARNKIPVPKIK